jgi:hypothetical protein
MVGSENCWQANSHLISTLVIPPPFCIGIFLPFTLRTRKLDVSGTISSEDISGIGQNSGDEYA